MRIECPHCKTSYPAALTGLNVQSGLAFTIRCSVCGESFDGRAVDVEGTPASRLHRWTGGRFGDPGTNGTILIETRVRA